MISIIIPTLNEEDYLEKLLTSIKRQSFRDYEIILSDAGSTDNTLNIARAFSCIIVKGGLPAKGRNEGAKVAKGDILFFLDADTILPDHFLNIFLQEFEGRKLDLASFGLIPVPRNRFSNFFVNLFYNQPIIFFEHILPHAATGIVVKKDIFERTGGFDETVQLAEDHYFARMAKKKTGANVGIIRSVKIFVSDRRFRTDGWLNIGMKYILCELHMIFIGPVKSDIFKYRFNHYKKNK